MSETPFRSGFCSIVGRPNVGKSTLLNAFVAAKLAIMSDKPQTTRNRILGVYNRPDAQVVFLDTPGIHKPRHRLGEYMNKVAISTIPEVDVVLFVVDGSVPQPGEGDKYVADVVARSGRPTILVVNKMDKVRKADWYGVMDAYKALADPRVRSENPEPGAPTIDWVDIVPVSALEHKNVDALLDLIVKQLDEGPKFYPDDVITDQPERFVIAELIREKILHLTRDEVPHSVAVDVEQLERRPTGTVYVSASIYVERESQKGILIGKRGSMLKEIGTRARQEIEQLLGSKIYLELFVKVKEDWRNKESVLRSLGYREE